MIEIQRMTAEELLFEYHKAMHLADHRFPEMLGNKAYILREKAAHDEILRRLRELPAEPAAPAGESPQGAAPTQTPRCPKCRSSRVTVNFSAWDGEGISARCREDLCEWTTKDASEFFPSAVPPDTPRKPDGYAYRYPSVWDGSKGTVIAFDTNGKEVNGSKPIESIPYYLGAAPPDTKELAGRIAALFMYPGMRIFLYGEGECRGWKGVKEVAAIIEEELKRP